MADTFVDATPRRLLVDGRDPFADETITVSDPAILSVAAPDANGQVFGTALADGTVTVTVDVGSEDANRTAGTDDVTVALVVAAAPLVVSFA
jgi:hypothetical protein